MNWDDLEIFTKHIARHKPLKEKLLSTEKELERHKDLLRKSVNRCDDLNTEMQRIVKAAEACVTGAAIDDGFGRPIADEFWAPHELNLRKALAEHEEWKKERG